MRSTPVTPGQTATVGQYNKLRDDAYASSWLLPHQKDTTPDLELSVEYGMYYTSEGLVVEFAGGDSPSFTAPSANPRIDVLSIDPSGTLVRTAGAEAGSPVAPDYPAGNIPICQVYNRVGQTEILDEDDTTNGYILYDLRPFVIGDPNVSDGRIALICGETIQNGDIAFLSVGDSRKFAFSVAGSTTEILTANTQSRGQTFTVPTGCDRLRRVGFYIDEASSPAGTVSVRVFATSGGLPTGSALASFSATASQLQGSMIQGDVDIAVTPGAVYALVVDVGSATLGGADTLRLFYGASTIGGGSRITGTSMGSWSADTGNDYSFMAEFQYESNRVFKYESAIALNGGKLLHSKRGVFGGDQGIFEGIKESIILKGFSGLVIGTKYYTSDISYGAITTVASGNILLGVAISTTEILVAKNRSFEATTVPTANGENSLNRTVGFRAPQDGFLEIRIEDIGNTGSSLRAFKSIEQQPLFSYDSSDYSLNFELVLEIANQSTSGEKQYGTNAIPLRQGDYLFFDDPGTVTYTPYFIRN